MARSHVCAVLALALLVHAGCSRQPLPASPNPPKDQAELEVLYEQLDTGIPETEIAAFLGKSGVRITGEYYASMVVWRKPSRREKADGETYRYWPSSDHKAAIRVAFGTDETARLIELVRLEPGGPPPGH